MRLEDDPNPRCTDFLTVTFSLPSSSATADSVRLWRGTGADGEAPLVLGLRATAGAGEAPPPCAAELLRTRPAVGRAPLVADMAAGAGELAPEFEVLERPMGTGDADAPSRSSDTWRRPNAGGAALGEELRTEGRCTAVKAPPLRPVASSLSTPRAAEKARGTRGARDGAGLNDGGGAGELPDSRSSSSRSNMSSATLGPAVATAEGDAKARPARRPAMGKAAPPVSGELNEANGEPKGELSIISVSGEPKPPLRRLAALLFRP